MSLVDNPEDDAAPAAEPCPHYARGACDLKTTHRLVSHGGWPAPFIAEERHQGVCPYPLHTYMSIHEMPMTFVHPGQAKHEQLQATCGLRGRRPG